MKRRWFVEIAGYTRKYVVEASSEEEAIDAAWEKDERPKDEIQNVFPVGDQTPLSP